MKWPEWFKADEQHGLRLALNVFIATTILWISLQVAAGVNPIWGIASMLSSSEPVVKKAIYASRGSFRNTLIGCLVGLAFVVFGRGHEWSLPISLMVSVLLSIYVARAETMWQQAPLTAAIVIAANLVDHPNVTPFEAGIQRVAEVLFGCVVGLVVSWIMSCVWPLPVTPETCRDT